MEIDYQEAYKTLPKDEFILLNAQIINYVIFTRFGAEYLEKETKLSVEDLTQEAFVKIIKIYSKYKIESGVKWTTFIIKIIENVFKMLIRRTKAKSRTAIVVSLNEKLNKTDIEYSEYIDTITSEYGELEKITEREDLEDIKIRLINSLSATENEVFKLMNLEEKIAQLEIAKHANLSQSYVSRIQKKIKNKCKIIMKRVGYDV